MKKITLVITAVLTLSFAAFAQNKDFTYSQKAEEIKNKVWGDDSPDFKVKTIPADLDKESAVIIASSLSVEQTSNGKIKMAFFMPVSGTKTSKVSIYRERVKINDKAALEDFSSVEYQKTLDRSQGALMFQNVDKKDIYIGAKIIKPDGTETIVNTSEEVLTKNDNKDKQGKLAIPNLQVGDILDYYVSKIEINDTYDASVKAGMAQSINNDYVWMLAGEYPTLSYTVTLRYSSKINVKYITANNAPDFKITTADNGDQIYSLAIKNVPKYDSKLWTSTYRQYPYIQLTSSYTNKFLGFAKTDNSTETRLDKTVKEYETMFHIPKQEVYFGPEEALKKYYKSGKALKNAPLDSSMAVFYNIFKYYGFCYYGNGSMDMSTSRNTSTYNNLITVIPVAFMLHDMDIDYDILLVSPRTTSTLENVFDMHDIKALIRINGGRKPLYMCFEDMFTQFNELPPSYQGEEVVVLSPKKHEVDKFDISKETLPVSGSDQNYIHSNLTVSMLPEDMHKVKITRAITEAGFLRHDDQQNLVFMEDYDHYFTATLHGEELIKRLNGLPNPKKLAAEYNNAFSKARESELDNFKSEIKSEFNEEPQQLTGYKITNIGLSDPDPLFKYTGTFVMGNFIKTAGNNYIVEIGKLIGPCTQIEEKERKRTIDVYMPGARSFSYDINFNIPKGYQLKGVDELNKQIKNETGSLTVLATVKGDLLNIKVNRAYTHNFEKAAQWPKLVEVVDAMYDLSKQKVLLEKI